MNQLISSQQYEEIATYCEDMDIYNVWGNVQDQVIDYHDGREAFLWVLRRLLQDGRIQLVKRHTHIPFSGTIDEQVEQFRQALPAEESGMRNGYWFFEDGCPGGCNWLQQGKSDFVSLSA